ncbi:MAG: hypothetical protein ACTII7_07765 [Galactobacter sp.]
MAEWTKTLPGTAAEGDTGHVEDHNAIVDAIAETRTNVDAAETKAAWATVTGKPATFPPTIGTTATTALAGNTTIPAAPSPGTAAQLEAGTDTGNRVWSAKILADFIKAQIAAAAPSEG